MADALSASRILQLPAAPPPPLPLHRSLRRFPLPARSELPKSFPAPTSSSIPPPRRSWTAAAAATSWNSVEEGAKVPANNDAPSSIQLLPLASEEEFDRIIADEPVVVLWMAKWCRKCIYLKPKLEKLAADYHPRIRFYCVDVNAVPQRLVSRAGITAPGSIAIDAKAILKRTSDVRRGAGDGGGSMYELNSSLMRMV